MNLSEYGPCPGCMEWLKLNLLPQYALKCTGLGSDEPYKRTKGVLNSKSNILSSSTTNVASKVLLEEVYPIMKQDKIREIVWNDPLIVALGNEWIKRNVGNKLMRKYYTSSVL